MNTLIKRIKENTVLTIITALFLGVVVFFLSRYLSSWTTSLIEKYIMLESYVEGVIYKLYTLVLSVAMIWFVNNKSLANFGFVKPKKINYLKMILITVVVTLISIIIGSILFMVIFPPETINSRFTEERPLLETILTVWVWSSITEEFLSRGLVQGFMNHLKNIKFAGLSVSVIFSGLFFGALHISTGVATIVFFTTIGGFVMAYYREKSDSILPAIYVHILANITGYLFGLMVLDMSA